MNLIKSETARELKKNSILFLLITGICFGLVSCKNDDVDDDDNLIIDYSPIEYEIRVVNSAGDNLLEKSVSGNILDTEMYIELAGEKYDVHYGRPDEPISPYPVLSRAYMPVWYGAFIAPYGYPGSELPDRGNRLFVGEFPGDASGEITFELYLDGNSYQISYVNKKNSRLDLDRHFYLDGKEIESSTITITL